MKQKLYILGLVTAIIILAGTIFKINHLAGAGKLLTVGFVMLILLFLPLAFRNIYRAEGTTKNMLLYIVSWITCFIVFTAMLFKIMHWPFAGIMMTIAIPFPYIVFLPVFLIITGRNKNFSIYNTVFVLMLLMLNSVFAGLLSLNVTRNRVNDSFNLSGNYTAAELVLDKIPSKSPDNPVVREINMVLSTVEKYRKLIMDHENISAGQWGKSPETILKPDIKGVAAKALLDSGDIPEGAELLKGLKKLITLLEFTPGYSELAKEAPRIFDIVSPNGNEADWYSWKFKENNLSWVLIYLDGLETNLKMIKATVK
ncbi:MAG TPA: hypothetical protein DEO60_13815 [Bacteroidales bacterium]|nr:hypothetical protein [Bacteroidales bacterium]HBZ22204.1 hypothetical protein [Bacteroidales bacterium]